MYAFGRNYCGQLGIESEDYIQRPTAHPFFKGGANEYRYRQIECGEYHTGVIDADGNVFLFGYNQYGQIGMGSREVEKVHQPFEISSFKCKQLAIGLFHTLLLTDCADGNDDSNHNNEVYACGSNTQKKCFQMESGMYVLSPALCTREAMGIGDQGRYGNVVRVIAGQSNSIIVVEKLN